MLFLAANHPIIDVDASDVVQMVWHRNQADSAELMYARCTSGGCDAGSEWDPDGPGGTPPQQVLVSGGDVAFPHIASAAGFTMIAYVQQFDVNDDGDVTDDPNRVFVISRCGTDAWSTPELVLDNPDVDKHQSMAFGRPGLVLNAQDHVAHLVMLDGLDDVDTTHATANADLYWARTPYEGCP